MLYYTPPSDEVFEEVRKAAIALWKCYDNTHGYADEKVNAIANVSNVGDNFMYIVAMFDIHNQRKLSQSLSETTRKEIRDRMIDGGNEPFAIVF